MMSSPEATDAPVFTRLAQAVSPVLGHDIGGGLALFAHQRRSATLR
jgi:hypothetical protein